MTGDVEKRWKGHREATKHDWKTLKADWELLKGNRESLKGEGRL